MQAQTNQVMMLLKYLDSILCLYNYVHANPRFIPDLNTTDNRMFSKAEKPGKKQCYDSLNIL